MIILVIKKIITVLFMLTGAVHATMMSPNSYSVSNADGETFEVRLTGSVHLNYLIAVKDGSILKFDKTTKNYTRAIFSQEKQEITSSSSKYTEKQLNAGLMGTQEVGGYPPQPTPQNLADIYQKSKNSFLNRNH
jgi:hypothetical protein